MKTYEPNSIRNVAIVGHGHSGKTSMVSAMLFTAGTTTRLGSVAEGSATTDFDPEEIDKKVSIQMGLAHLEWDRTKVNLIDTPGYANFIFEAKAGLRAADGAVVLIESVAGVQIQTERVWAFCDEFALPRLVVVSRMDRDNASAERALASAQAKFGRGLTPIQLPMGAEKNFKGVIDLVEMRAWLHQGDGTGLKPSEIPAEFRDDADRARRSLMELVAELDDQLMERYLETEILAQEDLIKGLRKGVRERRLVPVVFSAGSANIGTQALIEAIVRFLPSPADREYAGSDPRTQVAVSRRCDVGEPCAALVFKTIADPFAGKLSVVRVYSGKLEGSSHVYNATRDTEERTGAMYLLQGKDHLTVPEITAGDIGAIPKLKETTTNDTLSDKDKRIVFAPIEFPEPAMSFAVEPKTRGDEDKLAGALARISEEDPTVHYGRDAETNELLLSGMGDTHLEVVVAKLKRKFGAEVVLHTPRVPYRETIKKSVEVHGRHKKQTGGHGQFADCKIRVEPLPRGSDFEFVDEIFGGAIPHNFRPAVEKGILEARSKGFLAGYPLVDFRVTLIDGAFHAVDSSEMAFKIAGAMAFRSALELAKPVLLEPIMNVSVHAPDECMGDILGQLNSRRGRVQGMDAGVVTAQVPMAEMLTFTVSLKASTSGRGTYHMEFSHYDEVPAASAQKIIQAAKRPEAAAD